MNDDGLDLDVAEPQILLHFDHDPNNLREHHRLLLCKLAAGRWVALTPDHEMEVLDLTTRRHLVLGRRTRFPAHLANEVYAFDPLTRNELEAFKRQAKTMSIVLGDSDYQEIEALVWIYADGTSDKLGELVPQAVVDNAVILGDRGLVDVDGAIQAIREVDQSRIQTVVEEIKGSAGDLRTIGNHADSQGKRFISLSDALPLMRSSKMEDWHFQGPRSVAEFLQSVKEGPCDLSAYHHQWVRQSGVSQHSSIVHEHRNIVEVLRLGVCRDQLDVTNLLSFELLVRRLVQLEVAVARSPSSPEFTGLDILLENPVDATGSASTRALDAWVTDRLKERANIQKQSRLFKEEMSHQSKSKGVSVEQDGGGGGVPWRKRRPKAKAKTGAGQAGAGDA